MRTLNSRDLESYMQREDIDGEILHLDSPTPTVASAAQAVGCLPEQIVKSILFLVDGAPVLAVACGPRRVEARALARRYGVGRKRVRLASPPQVLEIAGYEVGAMPPFGHREPLPTLLDPSVLPQAEVYAGGGEEDALLRTTPSEIARAAAAESWDLHTPQADDAS
jgi:prolyl-tRNA editing enzyme YbaK/EbsC (Cys-tRNA(Pro) deacylase)